MRVYTVSLEDMQFVGFHGCREDEKRNGNVFMVDFTASYKGLSGETDKLEDAVNYGAVYRVIAREMAIRADLLEHLAHRIIKAVTDEFPQLLDARVTVSKKNPPVDGPCAWSRVSTEWKRENE